jgi:hypothetical protein
MKNLPTGFCHLCGCVKELNYEHVPPQAAFNHFKFVKLTADEYWNGVQAGRKKVDRPATQGGHGVYTLCIDCNSKTGGYYGRAFIEWCRRGFELYNQTRGEGSDLYFCDIRPLRILKQLTTMFIAMNMNDQNFRNANISLVRFVQDRYAQWLDPRYRFWAYYVAPGPLRMTPFACVMNTEKGGMFSGMEISFPPFGYMLTFDSKPEDDRLTEITGFRSFQYWDRDMIRLRLNVLPTHGPMMGDYRYFKPLTRTIDETRYIITM